MKKKIKHFLRFLVDYIVTGGKVSEDGKIRTLLELISELRMCGASKKTIAFFEKHIFLDTALNAPMRRDIFEELYMLGFRIAKNKQLERK